jgi:predicted SAM-dependent methyltransferase
MGKVFGVNVVIGIPSFGMVSTYFYQAMKSQQFPLVSSAIDHVVLDKPIAEARNEIVEFALSQGAHYIFWVDDDVIPPPDAFLRLYNHQKDIINGVYWSKSNPPMPLLFRNHLEGPYWDWHIGDLIEIDAAGNGLTLVKTNVYKTISEKVGGPWYSTEYASFKGINTSPANNTEDLYFYWKARKAGFKIWADTRVQAMHFDKTNKVLYHIPPRSPQMNPAWEIKPEGKKLIADIGSGPVSPYFRDEGKVVSFDIREETKPDVVCDVRYLPCENEVFDIVFSSHTLEHFGWVHVDKVLKEWCRVLKIGGELRLVVPNLKHVAKRLLNDELTPTDIWVLYGEQDYPKNFHAMGFTPKILHDLVESLGIFENIQVKEGNIDGPPGGDSWNLMLKATKVKNIDVDNITPDYIEGAPSSPNMWPLRLFEDYNERPMTPEEITADKLRWLNSSESVDATSEEANVLAPAGTEKLRGVKEKVASRNGKAPNPPKEID